MNVQTITRSPVTNKQALEASLFSSTAVADVRRFKAVFDERTKMQGLHSEVMTITPAVAEYVLANFNPNNRSLSPEKVRGYANAMSRGEFRLTSQGISFSSDGKLNNGQHRLHAIVMAAMPIAVYVTFGEDRLSFTVLDSGGARTNADALSIAGKSNTTILAATARLLSYVKGDYNGSEKLTASQTFDVVSANPGIDESVTLSLKITKKFKCSSAAAACACYLISSRSRSADKLGAFVDALVLGADLSKNAPLLKLREGLFQRTIDAQYRRYMDKNYVLTGTIINTWNKWVRGRVGAISFDPKHDFPGVE